jgi:RNA polymerase sigma factor (sigma-70 family)
MNTKSDTELLQAWHHHRDEGAFRTLIERHGALLAGVARRRLGEADLAPDMAGKAFALLAERPQRIPQGEVVGWLVRVTIHLCDTENRAHRRRLRRDNTAAQEFARNQTQMNPRPDDRRHEIDNALLSLSAAERECLLLHAAEGLTHREVGDRLGVSEDAARMRCNRAIDRIRRKLGFTAGGVLVAVENLKAAPLSTSDQDRMVAAAHTAPSAAGGSLLLGWILMTNTQRLAIVIAAALLFVGGTGAVLQAQGVFRPAAAGLATPELSTFTGTWRGSLTYVVRRSGRRVNLNANSEVTLAPNGLRMKVAYDDPGWNVDASVQVLPQKGELIFTDKGDRQQFKLISRSPQSFTGQRFVDEPGRPRDERMTFRREGDIFSVLIEEKLRNQDWVFANEHRMERVR